MNLLEAAGNGILAIIKTAYFLLWGDIITIPLPGGSSLGRSEEHTSELQSPWN